MRTTPRSTTRLHSPFAALHSTVGTSAGGTCDRVVPVVAASRRSFRAEFGADRDIVVDHHLDIVAQQRHHHFRRAAERHDGEVDAGRRLQQLGGKILARADIDGADVEACRDFPWRISRCPAMDCVVRRRIGGDDEIEIAEARNRHEIAFGVERQRLEQRHADRCAVGEHRPAYNRQAAADVTARAAAIPPAPGTFSTMKR